MQHSIQNVKMRRLKSLLWNIRLIINMLNFAEVRSATGIHFLVQLPSLVLFWTWNGLSINHVMWFPHSMLTLISLPVISAPPPLLRPGSHAAPWEQRTPSGLGGPAHRRSGPSGPRGRTSLGQDRTVCHVNWCSLVIQSRPHASTECVTPPQVLRHTHTHNEVI